MAGRLSSGVGAWTNLRTGTPRAIYRGGMPDTIAHLRTGRRWWHVSGTGVFFGAAYVLISMSPSLLPRTWYYQGMITGLCAAAGYALGVALAWLVRTVARVIDLRIMVSGEARHWILVAAPVFAGVAVVAVTVVERALAGAHRRRRAADPLSPLDWALALLLAAAIAAALIALARGLRAMTHRLAEAAGHVLPKTIASTIAVVVRRARDRVGHRQRRSSTAACRPSPALRHR